jgi:hypothetical protein
MCPLGRDGMSADPDVRACDATFESKQSECQAAHPARNSINSGRPRGKFSECGRWRLLREGTAREFQDTRRGTAFLANAWDRF